MGMNNSDCLHRKRVKELLAKFNFRYYEDETKYHTYHYDFESIQASSVAYHLEDVKDVLAFAEAYQKKGEYVGVYLPYEAAPAFDSDMEVNLPETSDYVYAAAYVFTQPEATAKAEGKHPPQLCFKFRLPDEMLQAHIQAVQEAIVAGNTYQVNYTTRLYDEIRMPITELYTYLTQTAHGNYTALLDTEELQVASISPELFFQKGEFKGLKMWC